MERVLRSRIREERDRFDEIIRSEGKEFYLDQPDIEPIIKMALDIKSAECHYDVGAGIEGVRCVFPISDKKKECHINVKAYLNLPVRYVELYLDEITELENGLGYLTFPYQKEIDPKNLQEEFKYMLEELENKYGNNNNFQILKEYLEED